MKNKYSINGSVFSMRAILILMAIVLGSMQNINAQPELVNFSWSSSSNEAGATGVTYTFSYEIVTPSPVYILDAMQYYSNSGCDFSAVTDKDVTVLVNDVEAPVINYPGSYRMMIKLEDANLASAGAKIQITINNVSNNANPGSFPWYWMNTANGAANAIDQALSPKPIVLTVPTSIEEDKKSEWQVYPNPTNGIVNVAGVDSYAKYEIYSITGSLAQKGHLTESKIDVSGLKAGMYILQIGQMRTQIIKK